MFIHLDIKKYPDAGLHSTSDFWVHTLPYLVVSLLQLTVSTSGSGGGGGGGSGGSNLPPPLEK